MTLPALAGCRKTPVAWCRVRFPSIDSSSQALLVYNRILGSSAAAQRDASVTGKLAGYPNPKSACKRPKWVFWPYVIPQERYFDENGGKIFPGRSYLTNHWPQNDRQYANGELCRWGLQNKSIKAPDRDRWGSNMTHPILLESIITQLGT